MRNHEHVHKLWVCLMPCSFPEPSERRVFYGNASLSGVKVLKGTKRMLFFFFGLASKAWKDLPMAHHLRITWSYVSPLLSSQVKDIEASTVMVSLYLWLSWVPILCACAIHVAGSGSHGQSLCIHHCLFRDCGSPCDDFLIPTERKYQWDGCG